MGADRRIRITTHRAAIVLGAILYAVLLQVTYVYDIQPRWSYMGLEHHEISLLVRTLYVLIAVAPSLWMPVHLARPSEVGYWFVYLIVFVPSVMIPHEVLGGPTTRWLTLSIATLACMGILGWAYSLPAKGFPRPRTDHLYVQFWAGFWLFAGGLYLIVATNFGLQLNLPSLSEVYEVRDEYAEMVRNQGVLGAYAVAWAGNVVNPFLILWGIAQRRRSFLVLGVLGQLALFSVTALKSLLLSMFLILALFLAVRRGGRNFGLWIMFGAVLLVAVGMLELRLFGTDLISGIMVRRIIIIPGQLMGVYVDFFSVNPKALLGYSVLKGIVPYPYDVPPPQLVAAVYFKVVQHANASIWADGFANFGYFGLFLSTAALAALFRVFDRASAGVDLTIATTIFGLPAFNLSNSGLLTCLMTHGIGLVVVLLYLLPRQSRLAARRGRVAG